MLNNGAAVRMTELNALDQSTFGKPKGNFKTYGPRHSVPNLSFRISLEMVKHGWLHVGGRLQHQSWNSITLMPLSNIIGLVFGVCVLPVMSL